MIFREPAVSGAAVASTLARYRLRYQPIPTAGYRSASTETALYLTTVIKLFSTTNAATPNCLAEHGPQAAHQPHSRCCHRLLSTLPRETCEDR